MKQFLSILLAILMLVSFSGCSAPSNDADNYVEDSYVETPEYDSTGGQSEYDSTGEQQPQADNAAEYISDRSIDYYSADKKFTAFFGLKNKAEEYISGAGKATIVIKDIDEKVIYKNTLTFTEGNFSTWSNNLWNTDKYLCALDISASKLPHSESSSGIATISVNLNDGTSFPEKNMTIYDLPTHDWEYATCTAPKTCKGCGAKEGSPEGHTYYSDGKCGDCGAINPVCPHDWEYATCTAPKTCTMCGATEGSPEEHTYYSDGKCGDCGKVNPLVQEGLSRCSLALPSLPYTLNEYDYDDNIIYTFQVTDITYEFDVDNDGYVSLVLYFSGTKSSDTRGPGQSDACQIGYKIYDADNNVIVSDTFYSPGIAMGEKFSNKDETAIDTYDDVKPGAYRLEILSTN